jgi:hypothetical protein
MRDTYGFQILCPAGISTEDILLIDRRYGICEWTFKIHDHSISLTEYRRYFLKEILYTPMLCDITHTTVKENIAREEYGERGWGGRWSGRASRYHPTPNTYHP